MRTSVQTTRAITAVCIACLLGCAKNEAPDKPRVFGPIGAAVGDSIRFRAFAGDPEGNDVAYLFDWGDASAAEWTTNRPSGETAMVAHVYADSGVYYVTAKARDAKGLESGWSDSLDVYVGVPATMWEPTAEDTAGIGEVILGNREFFGSAFDERGMRAMDTVLPGTSAVRLRNEVRANPFKQRFRCDQMEHVFFSDSFDIEFAFIASLDSLRAETTCAVAIAETIPGRLSLHAYSYTRYLRESLVVISPGETLRLPVYDSLFSDTSMMVEKRLAGTSTNGCVLRKAAGQWGLWKVAGGSRFFAPGPDDAPYISWLCLEGGGREDTVYLRPDTLQSGIQRFFAPEALPTYAVGDSLRVTGFAANDLDVAGYVCLDHTRYELAPSSVPLTKPGLQRFFFELMPVPVLYEMDGDYVATVWGIAVNVEP